MQDHSLSETLRLWKHIDDGNEFLTTEEFFDGQESLESVTVYHTRPSATVEGLETVSYEVEKNGKWYSDHPQSWAVRKNNGATVRRLCDQSQAEAIIAAERTMRKYAEERIIQSERELKQARTDNAALTSRIKEIEYQTKVRGWS